MATLVDIRNNVLEYGFSGPRYSAAVTRWINEAQRFVVKNSNLKTENTTGTIITTPNAPNYSLPSNFSRIIDISYPTEQDTLEEIDDQITYDNLTVDTGRPTSFLIIGDQIFFYPTPDAVYTFNLNYWKSPVDLSADADVPEIPSEYHVLLEDYAIAKAYRREGDLNKAQAFKQDFDRQFAEMKYEIGRGNQSQPKQLPGTWSNFQR